MNEPKVTATTNKGIPTLTDTLLEISNTEHGDTKTGGYKALSRDELLKVSSEEMNKYEIYVKTHYRLTPQQEEEIRHQKRLVKSREFAKKSRKRVQEQICALESKNAALERQVSDLELQNKALKMSNVALSEENTRLKGLVKQMNNAGETRLNASVPESAQQTSSQHVSPLPPPLQSSKRSGMTADRNHLPPTLSPSMVTTTATTTTPPITTSSTITTTGFSSDDKRYAKERCSNGTRDSPLMTSGTTTRFNGYILFFIVFSALTVLVYDLPPNIGFSSARITTTTTTAAAAVNSRALPAAAVMNRPDGWYTNPVGGLRKMLLFDMFGPTRSPVLAQNGYFDKGGQRTIGQNCNCVYSSVGNESLYGVGADWVRDSNGKRSDFVYVLFLYPLCYLIIAGRRRKRIRDRG